MAENIENTENNKVVEETTELTAEEKAEAWAKWVRSEVNAALDIYIDKAVSGHINVKYYPHVLEVLESGPVVNKDLADGVLLSVVFEFEKPIDLTKPRVEDSEK
jgi:hypothetical protein